MYILDGVAGNGLARKGHSSKFGRALVKPKNQPGKVVLAL